MLTIFATTLNLLSNANCKKPTTVTNIKCIQLLFRLRQMKIQKVNILLLIQHLVKIENIINDLSKVIYFSLLYINNDQDWTIGLVVTTYVTYVSPTLCQAKLMIIVNKPSLVTGQDPKL